jgi:hypothetical protein
MNGADLSLAETRDEHRSPPRDHEATSGAAGGSAAGEPAAAFGVGWGVVELVVVVEG